MPTVNLVDHSSLLEFGDHHSVEQDSQAVGDTSISMVKSVHERSMHEPLYSQCLHAVAVACMSNYFRPCLLYNSLN